MKRYQGGCAAMDKEQTLENVDATDLMIDDLAGQVARKSVEVAQWKARAIKAEATIERLKTELADDADAEQGDGAEDEEQETDGEAN